MKTCKDCSNELTKKNATLVFPKIDQIKEALCDTCLFSRAAKGESAEYLLKQFTGLLN